MGRVADLRHFALARRAYLVDAVVALVLVVLTRTYQTTGSTGGKGSDQLVISIYVRDLRAWWLFGALMAVGLLIQHRWPLLALVLATAGAVLQYEPDMALQPLHFAVPITLYTLAVHTRARWISMVALGVLTAAVFLRPVVDHVIRPQATGLPSTGMTQWLRDFFLVNLYLAVSPVLVLVAAFALGDAMRSRRAHLRVLEEQAAGLAREQRQRVALAIAAERARITRELHDVVAHGLSVVVMQAQGGAAALKEHPDQAADALQNVIVTGRSAMADMRSLLGLARGDAELTPLPGVGGLPSLVDRVRAAGTPVGFSVDGTPGPLPASVDLSAYRIAQEALTNIMKHAGAGARATVRLAFGPDELEIEVSDDGTGASAAATGSGLRGIAERVSLLGGKLTAGPGEAGGFRVWARLPLRPAEAKAGAPA